MNKHSSVPSVLLIDIEDKLGGIISVEDAVKLTQAFAKGVGKEAPIDDVREDPFISSEDVLKENIDSKAKEQIEFELYDKEDKVNKEKIREFIETLYYPLYFLDFETFQQSIPQYEDIKPSKTDKIQY